MLGKIPKPKTQDPRPEITMKQRYIAHVDMDAFFASVEQRDNPEYSGKPVIVGSDPKEGRGRGVVAACSYEARAFGIHSALPISIAYRKCPDAVFLRPDMSKYSQASHEVFDILESFTPEIEPVSVDEAFMDITGSWHLFGTPEETCLKIKQKIKKITGLTASVGLAPNKMTAKIASDIKKPDGLVVVKPEDLLGFLHPLPVGKLWGVGVKTLSALNKMGIHTIGDLASQTEEYLHDNLGENGSHMWYLANGIDPRHVESLQEIKSISNEYTFEKDTSEKSDILDVIMYLSEKVSRRLRLELLTGRTITLKIRFQDFKTFTRALTTDSPTNFVDIIYAAAAKKLDEFDISKNSVRLLGVKVSNFADPLWQDDLFSSSPEAIEKKDNLHKALDKILDRYGEGSVRRRG